MSEKKVVGKNIFVITLIICIAVSVGLVAMLATYLPTISNLESELIEKDQELTNLNTTITNLSLQMIALEDQITQKNSEITSLRGNYETVLDLQNRIITLQESGYLANGVSFSQNATLTHQVYNGLLEYAGYIQINAQSNSTTTYVKIVYDSFGTNVNQKIIIGESGTISFPILPGEVEIIVGNDESINVVNGIITINYVY
jgi:hypothetical protein